MTEKLIRNTSDERWEKFWKGVDAAAERAPELKSSAAAGQSNEQGQAVCASRAEDEREL